MNKSYRTRQQLMDELQELTSRAMEAEETLRAIRGGEVDGLVVSTGEGDRVFTLSGADHPYRVMVETLNEGAVTLASDGTILFCNQRFADIVKGSLEKVMGSSIYQYISSTDLQLFEGLLEQGLKGNSKGELALQTEDENSAPALFSISALEHTDMPGAVCLVVTDLTDQKRSEEMLAEEKLTTQILHQAAEIFVLCDDQGRILRASQSTNRLFGRSPIFQTFDEAFHLFYLDGTPFVLLPAMSDKFLHAVEVTLKHGDNKVFSFLLSARSLFNNNGLLGIVVVMVDFTERKKMEETLKNAHDLLELRVQERTVELERANKHLAEQSCLLESFFKDTITPLVLLDREFNFIRVNEAYARSCQRAVPDFLGHNHFEFYPHEENEAIFRRVVETGISYQALAKPFSFPDHPEWGVTYWDWILTPLPDDRGETAFLVFSLEEVTDRQEAEEALRKSEQQLRTLTEQLLYAQENERKRIARDMHDSLGAALSALKYKMEDLAHNLSDLDPRQIGGTLDSLIKIIQETIAETRRMQNNLRPPLLDDLGILPTLSWFSREFQKTHAGIAIEQRLEVREEDVPELMKVVIFRITQEALNNIGKHAQANQVRIYLGREQDRVNLVIRDDGMGFEFKRLRQSAASSSGMGLSSMKERAELSGGSFSIESHPDQGTVIEVSWPLNKRIGVEHQADSSFFY